MDNAEKMLGYAGDILIKAGIEYGPEGEGFSSNAGATNSGRNITVNSTSSLVPGMEVSVISGTGGFPVGTTIESITSPTVFVASAAPTTNLSGSAVVRARQVITPEWVVCPTGCIIQSLEEYQDGVSIDVMSQHGLNPGDTLPDNYILKSSRQAGFSLLKITGGDANGFVITPQRNRNNTNSVNSGIYSRG